MLFLYTFGVVSRSQQSTTHGGTELNVKDDLTLSQLDGLGVDLDPEVKNSIGRAYLKDKERRSKQESQPTEAKQNNEEKIAQQIELDLSKNLFDEHRAAPNLLLRSSLFRVVGRSKREHLKREKIATWGGVEMMYTGEELGQADLDVWLYVLDDYIRPSFGDESGEFVAYKILTDLGKNTSKRDYDWLYQSLERMSACAVHLKYKQFEYAGGLITEVARNKQSNEMLVVINPTLADMFKVGGWTQLPSQLRQNLSGDFSKWLHAFLSTHRASKQDPLRTKVEKIKLLAGSRTKHLWKFRQLVRNSLKELEGANIVSSWHINKNTDLLTVVTT